ncbi:MAG: hypothetical protein HOK92_09760, partial [Flavobacteriales bacterium]|nr:hypothetical protein [Flavobacteriales bacterium]
SLIKLLIASKGNHAVTFEAASIASLEALKNQRPMSQIIFSPIHQTTIAPIAKADLFTKIPRNNPKEKNPTSFIKKAKRYSKSEVIIVNSL